MLLELIKEKTAELIRQTGEVTSPVMQGDLIKVCETTDELVELSINNGFTTKTGYPLKCGVCGNMTFNERTIEYIAGTVGEAAFYCEACNTEVAYWSYGTFLVFAV